MGIPKRKLEKEAKRIDKAYHDLPGGTIAVLQDIQETFGYIPEEAIRAVAEKLGVPESRFFGIATFYSQFYMSPRGRNIITACTGTACHVKGSERIISGLQIELGLTDDAETTSDGEFSLGKVNCVGACSIAPVVLVNRKVYGKAALSTIKREIKKFRKEGAEGKSE